MEQIAFLRNANIGRSGQPLLKHVTMSMSGSEFVYLIGKTGSGKSTLLKTLWGEVPLAGGQGAIAGVKLETITPGQVVRLRRQIGIVFQDFHLFEDWTLRENLLYVLEATGWRDQGQMETRIGQVLQDVQLAHYSNRQASQLSGGEQQRLVIARSILNRPSIVLADEPTGNLDPDTSFEILKLLRGLAVRYHTAILMATHDRQILAKFPGRVYHCTQGKVRELEN